MYSWREKMNILITEREREGEREREVFLHEKPAQKSSRTAAIVIKRSHNFESSRFGHICLAWPPPLTSSSCPVHVLQQPGSYSVINEFLKKKTGKLARCDSSRIENRQR